VWEYNGEREWEWSGSSAVKEQEFCWKCTVSSCKLTVMESDCKKQGVSKTNHLIQNPLLLVTESRTGDNIYIWTLYFSRRINEYIASVARENVTTGFDEKCADLNNTFLQRRMFSLSYSTFILAAFFQKKPLLEMTFIHSKWKKCGTRKFLFWMRPFLVITNCSFILNVIRDVDLNRFRI
jgi:hypothetical protein